MDLIPTIKAIFILTGVDGKPLLAKYYDNKLEEQRSCLEDTIFTQTNNNNRTKDNEVLIVDGNTIVYKSITDLLVYIVGGGDEDPLILSPVLDCLVDVITSLLLLVDNNGDEHQSQSRINDNLPKILMALDKICDKGVIIDTDPSSVLKVVSNTTTARATTTNTSTTTEATSIATTKENDEENSLDDKSVSQASAPAAMSEVAAINDDSPLPKHVKKDKEDEDLEEGEVKDDDDDNDVDNNNINDGNDNYNTNNNNNNHENSASHKHTPHHYPRTSTHASNHHQHHHPYGSGALPPQSMNHKIAHSSNIGASGGGYRGGSAAGGPGPMPSMKVNIPCRHYSKNKCLWGDQCRFEHRDDLDYDSSPGSSRGMPPMSQGMPPAPHHQHPPMYPDRSYPPMYRHHQPYMPPHMAPYPYDPYHGPRPMPMPPHHHPPSHWRPSNAYSPHHQQSPYPLPSNSPGHLPPDEQLPSRSNPSTMTGGPAGTASSPGASGTMVTAGRGPSPDAYPPSSAILYERKQQLAYEAAPWNNRGPGYQSRYDREPAHMPPNSGRPPPHRSYREPPYKREPPPYGYPNYHPSYRNPAHGSQGAPYNRFGASSQRPDQPESSRPRKHSSKRRRHDEGESSWSDSGSEDSFLGQGSYSRNTKVNKTASDVDDRGTGTPPGEPLPDDKPETIEALKKLKEIEDLIKLKKEEQNN